jgi:hypothetical protein
MGVLARAFMAQGELFMTRINSVKSGTSGRKIALHADKGVDCAAKGG